MFYRIKDVSKNHILDTKGIEFEIIQPGIFTETDCLLETDVVLPEHEDIEEITQDKYKSLKSTFEKKQSQPSEKDLVEQRLSDLELTIAEMMKPV